MDRKAAMKAVGDFLKALGEDVTREGLQDTPRRVADAFAEFTSGENLSPESVLERTFELEHTLEMQEGESMVIERDIEFSSTCEHHLMPFFGKISIAYIPDGRVVGLSKLARCVDICAKRLQLQERLTRDIAEAIQNYLAPRGVLVYCEAEHTCMTCRGVKKAGSRTVTYFATPQFPGEKVAEILALLK